MVKSAEQSRSQEAETLFAEKRFGFTKGLMFALLNKSADKPSGRRKARCNCKCQVKQVKQAGGR
jgi:hypothetical protein